jgi:hypothetical protein
LGILFSSILCTCPNQRNLCSLIVSVMVGFISNFNYKTFFKHMAPFLIMTYLVWTWPIVWGIHNV